MKINGWIRIGIIASFMWMLGGARYALYERDISDAWMIKMSVDTELQCESYSFTDTARRACIQTNDEFLNMLSDSQSMAALHQEMAIIAFGPIPFAWGFVFMVLGLGRWIKRGFAVRA